MSALWSKGIRTSAAAVVIGAVLSIGIPGANARDFFLSFFDILSGRPPPATQPALGYGPSDDNTFPPREPSRTVPISAGESTAHCVRTCDGRHFPLSTRNEQARAAACSNLCPASDTQVFYGSSIEHARSRNGRSYAALPTAFKYREQLVDGCTCNGKDVVGLATLSIDEDKTIRKGDIVAGADGLIVATRSADRRRGKVAAFSPAPARVRARFERALATARDQQM